MANYNNERLYKTKGNNSLSQSSQKPSSLQKCLDHLKIQWNKNKNIASLWQDWPKIAGDQLASNCSPINFRHGIPTIGASHPQWIQALIFNRNQLLAALKEQGHEIKELRIKRHYPQEKQKKEAEKDIWNEHPSRADIHGKKTCSICHSPAPAGEISLWGKCGLCRRIELSPNM